MYKSLCKHACNTNTIQCTQKAWLLSCRAIKTSTGPNTMLCFIRIYFFLVTTFHFFNSKNVKQNLSNRTMLKGSKLCKFSHRVSMLSRKTFKSILGKHPNTGHFQTLLFIQSQLNQYKTHRMLLTNILKRKHRAIT